MLEGCSLDAYQPCVDILVSFFHAELRATISILDRVRYHFCFCLLLTSNSGLFRRRTGSASEKEEGFGQTEICYARGTTTPVLIFYDLRWALGHGFS